MKFLNIKFKVKYLKPLKWYRCDWYYFDKNNRRLNFQSYGKTRMEAIDKACEMYKYLTVIRV